MACRGDGRKGHGRRCEQDESIFKAYQKSLYQWVVHGIRGLRKKTDGPGEMVSGFKDEIRGFGHPMTPEELAAVNAFRDLNGRPPLIGSPAVRFLSYGKNKDGYWTYEHFASQVVDILDMYEALYPGVQILIEVDWSSGLVLCQRHGGHLWRETIHPARLQAGGRLRC